MSEFQCYQFKTIDRPLSNSEREEVNSWSSRGEVTSTTATFIYHYGDFKKDPEWAVEHYFDAMIYFANWGTRRLLLKLPANLIKPKELTKYCTEVDWSGDYIRLEKKGQVYLLDLYFANEEGGEWMEDEDFDIHALGQTRDELIAENYISLYLLWTKMNASAEMDDEDDDDEDDDEKWNLAPPLPANFKKVDSKLKAFIEYFEIDDSIVKAAKAASATVVAKMPEYSQLLKLLPDAERLDWLERVLKEEPNLGVLLKKRLEEMGKK
jgi:hypothetical protein